MKIKDKIAFVNNKHLKGLEHIVGGHYVYINEDNMNGTCNVNVITSLEDKNQQFNYHKISHVRKGNTYSIPYYDANFSKWSGVTTTLIKNVPIDKLCNIGEKRIKDRHKFYIGKFCKKNDKK